MIIRDKTAEEIVALKKKLIELSAAGLSVKEVLIQCGVDRSNVKTLTNADWMFGHHLIQARERGRILKENEKLKALSS